MARSSLAPILVVALAGCGASEPCIDDATFFRTQVYPRILQETCMACHVADGLARASDLVFVTPARPDHVEVNRAIFEDVAGLQRDGVSIVLIKPTGGDAHGGGAVLAEDSEAMALLREYVERLGDPATCEGDAEVVDADAGLRLLSPVQTLRKAALLLAGRLPTAAETDAVRDGGEAALVRVLWRLMDEPTFLEVFKERFNDVLLTDRYLLGDDGIGIFDDDRFPSVYYYDGLPNGSRLRARTADAIAREPLELAAWVVANGRPWTEVLTADYTVVNDYTAMAYGLEGAKVPNPDDPASLVFREARIPGFPHAGLLTTPAFLNRHPTTPTNRNRHRAWFFFKAFLATDVLTFADRPIDPAVSDTHNPTLNDPQCTVCHATLDPVAGTFQQWDDEGRLSPPESGWYPEMAPPGFGEVAMPAAAGSNAVGWLAAQAVNDPRFAVSAVRTMLEAFTGIELLTPELAGKDEAKRAALEAQDAWVEEVAAEFAARGHDIRYAIERVVLSRYFRAVADAGASPGSLVQAGTAHLLTPEELDRKIVATTGYPWKARASDAVTLLGERYRMLYGGIDSFAVTTRLRDPNGIMGAIGLRMAQEMACLAVPSDFVLARDQRRLFPFVEPTYTPVTPDGFAVPEAERAIRRNLQWLHLRLLGEDLELDSREIDASYQLWLDLWNGGRAGVADGSVGDDLPDDCRAESDPFTGDRLPSARRVVRDADFTIRAWAGVTAYLLADWRFLYE